jgi:hypothetical protein
LSQVMVGFDNPAQRLVSIAIFHYTNPLNSSWR